MHTDRCARGSACILHDAPRTSQHLTPNDATSGASDATDDGGAIFITARLADYGRLADRLAILAETAYIVTLRHPDDPNAAATLRELLTLALDAHTASIAQDLHFVDLHGREVNAADWHELARLRDTSEALRHIVARLTQLAAPQPLPLASAPTPAKTSASASASASEAQQTAHKRRAPSHPVASPVALLATSDTATRNRRGHTHA